MGILETLEQAAGVGAPAGTGGSGVVGAVLQMLQSQPGALVGVLRQFQLAGLGGVANSWLGAGPNQPVSPEQVQSALGPGPVAQIAQALGVSHEQAAGHVAQLLPLIVDRLSPNGQAPIDSVSALEGLIAHFEAR